MNLEVQEAIQKEWEQILLDARPPKTMRQLKIIDFKSLWAQVFGNDISFVSQLIESIYSGDVYVLTNSFSPTILTQLKNSVFAYGEAHKKGEYPLIDGCPNFHADYNYDARFRGGYGFRSISYNFFRWNSDPLGIFKFTERPYHLMKSIAGFGPEAFVSNLPRDGTIDRCEIIQYPVGGGGIDMHFDPSNNVRFTMGVNLTQQGIDYTAGGFEVVDETGTRYNVENVAPLGSIVSFFPSLIHGVSAIDPEKELVWNTPNGRWFIGISSVHSHMVQDRDKSLPVDGYKRIHEFG